MSRRRERTSKFNPHVIKRYNGEVMNYDNLFMNLPSNTWQRNENSTPEEPWVDFKCRACGFIHSILPSQYTIHEDGLVEPKYRSPNSQCANEEWIKLGNWTVE